MISENLDQVNESNAIEEISDFSLCLFDKFPEAPTQGEGLVVSVGMAIAIVLYGAARATAVLVKALD